MKALVLSQCHSAEQEPSRLQIRVFEVTLSPCLIKHKRMK